MKLNLVCVDLGNTNLHGGAFVGSELIAEQSTATDTIQADPRKLASMIEDLASLGKGPWHAAFCSVVPNINSQLNALLSSRFETVFELSSSSCIGLPIASCNPEEVGADRLANAIAAQTYHGTPAIVIDLGTATTFDVIGSKSGYEGGIIAPGLNLMTEYLAERTALLPQMNPHLSIPDDIIGRSTHDAMQLGCSLGFPSMIEGILNPLKKELAIKEGKEPKLVLTGGTAENLNQALDVDLPIDPILTLRGLAEAFRRDQVGH